MQEYISLSRKLSSVKAAVSAIPNSNCNKNLTLNPNVSQMEDYEHVLKRFMREMNTNQTIQAK